MIAWLFRAFQYYGIFFGYSYTYIDIENIRTKSNTYVKIYVYILNLVSFIAAIYYIKYSLGLCAIERALSYVQMLPSISLILAFFSLLLQRFKEDRYPVKLKQKFLHLQRTYLANLSYTSCDRTAETCLIFGILLVFINKLYFTYKALRYMIEGNWLQFGNGYINHLLVTMPYYILLQHGFKLFYINYMFLKINNQLEYMEVREPIAKVYITISLVLKQMNLSYSPVIFFALFYILVSNVFIIFYIFSMYDTMYELDLLVLSIQLLLLINIFLYYLICERVYQTANDTNRIIMEYCTKATNQEVGICLDP